MFVREDGALPRAWVVVTLAIIGGIVGAGIGLGVALWRQGELLGGPDPTRFIIDNAWSLGWAAIGGGVGWLAGTVLGWRVDPRAMPPSTASAWALRTLAAGFVAAGVLTLSVIPSAEEARGSDTNIGYDVTSLTWIVVLDTALAVSTLFVLSRRTRTSSWVVASGGFLAVATLIGAVVWVSSVRVPERAWLEYWLSTRQASLGAAPNLIVPASERCQPRSPDPYPGDDRSFSSDIPSVYYWINPFAPRWLPEGFGLDLDRSWPWPQPHGVWTDTDCREVTLTFKHGQEEVLRLDDVPPDVADWRLVTPTWCGDEPSDCREYLVGATIRGSHDTTLLVLRTAGLSPSEANRIARSIPTNRAAYI